MKKLIAFLFIAGITTQALAQAGKVTLSGHVKDTKQKTVLAFVNVALHHVKDSSFIIGTITNEEGRFSLPDVNSGAYFLKLTYVGYQPLIHAVLAGQLSNFIDLGSLELFPETQTLTEVTVVAKADAVASKMDKKTFNLGENISQAGGSALEAIKNLPGITVGQDGKVQLRGSDKVMVLIDGKQTALTGFGSQSGLDNIPASAIEKIEIINNPSARYDANGNAGIINIIYKKEKKEGFNGKIALATGLGALWIKQENYPGIRPQYQATPKINPSISLNYRKNKLNLYLKVENLYTQTLNKT